MADDVDMASEREEIAREKAIKHIQNKPLAVQPVGHCLSCGETLADDKLWCNNTCRDDWQRWNPEA